MPITKSRFSVTIGGDLVVTRIGFGAMRLCGSGVWGGPRDPDAARMVLRRAIELGVTLIDTADAYGPEVNEQFIAETLRRSGSFISWGNRIGGSLVDPRPKKKRLGAEPALSSAHLSAEHTSRVDHASGSLISAHLTGNLF